MSITSQAFGETPKGEPVTQFTIKNAHGLSASIITYGATLVSMNVPDRNGQFDDVTLGYENMEGYLSEKNSGTYLGASVGRYANRIADGKFSLNGKDYSLLVNNGLNHLHGGGEWALCWKNWSANAISENAVTFSVKSHDGEEGYPGNLELTVTYTLTDINELRIDYRATTDQDTVINFTNHAYWNLGGHDSGKVAEHQLQIFSDEYLLRNEREMPTGQFANVEGTPMDFRQTKTLAPDWDQVEEFSYTQGFDHSYVLKREAKELVKAALYQDPNSGRGMEVLTTEPSVHLYSAGFLEDLAGKSGVTYNAREAICLECQNFPDAPNHSNFPSSVLKKGEVFESSTVHRFGICGS